jgi:hypothetical protein
MSGHYLRMVNLLFNWALVSAKILGRLVKGRPFFLLNHVGFSFYVSLFI